MGRFFYAKKVRIEFPMFSILSAEKHAKSGVFGTDMNYAVNSSNLTFVTNVLKGGISLSLLLTLKTSTYELNHPANRGNSFNRPI